MMKTFLLLLILSLFDFNESLEGSNICYKNEIKVVDVKEETTKIILKETYGWCWTKIPPRCRKKKKISIPEIKIVPKITYVKVETCCEGYVQASNRCMPICVNSCGHGQCIGPEECECGPGWAGSSCNLTCNNNKWGPNCSNECECKNGSRCDPMNGSCICLPGYRGNDCVHQCDCFNGGICDKQTGDCDCKPGYSGRNCEARCVTGSFGKHCESACDCLYGAGCNFITGDCYCLKGYSGKRCEERNCSIIDCDYVVSVNSLLRNDISSEDKSSLAPIIAIACLLCIVIFCVSAFLILKNKKKIHELKNELAYVSYSAEKPQDRYDNPVYAYPNLTNPSASSVSSPSSNLPLQSISMIKNINNDLSLCKNNLQKAKMDNISDDNNCIGATGGSEETFYKIGNENLNIYHNIDDKKLLVSKEPIYDEIPLKSNEKEFDEDDNFDHLHYDKPKLTVRSNFDYPSDKS